MTMGWMATAEIALCILQVAWPMLLLGTLKGTPLPGTEKNPQEEPLLGVEVDTDQVPLAAVPGDGTPLIVTDEFFGGTG